ncbi:MAG: type II toxin-antitoxin system HicA family toxin [Chloroflexota bacterium]|nr:type II toxin-antitoxin system HicA family toxin [Chloroflexota bacterium]MDE2682553.1 type II toxin-antitoxin system HicA family toxin [Chloroflexota bacterium]
MHSREVLRLLREDGWYVHHITGSHHQMRHPDKPGTTTVTHPQQDVPIGTLVNIEKQSGVRLRPQRRR